MEYDNFDDENFYDEDFSLSDQDDFSEYTDFPLMNKPLENKSEYTNFPSMTEKDIPTKIMQSTLPNFKNGDRVINNDNTFVIIKEIGKGNFGITYLVDKDGTLLVLKLILKDILDAEIQNLVKLSNYPNCNKHIVCYHESFNYKNYKCIVMEHIEGITFSKFIRLNSGKISEDVIWDIITQLIDGLWFIHKNNIAHRDISKENIMIDKNYVIKYIDFGLSCFNQECKIPSPYQVSYQPPELYVKGIGKNLKYYQGVDVWSIGLILFELINGSGNFPNFTVPKIYDVNKGIEKNIKKLFKFSYEDKVIEFLIQKLLEIDPNKRFTAKDAYLYVRKYS